MTPPHSKGVNLAVSGLGRSFSGVPVLSEVHLSVEAGSICVIMGASGSGKSVLLRHLVGLETPDEGSILYNGSPLSEAITWNQIEMAIVFQQGGLLHSLDVGENIALYLRETKRLYDAEVEPLVDQAITQVGLDVAHDKHKMPSDLSGGMKKRVAIARALAIDPGIIFYDEPTSELDPVTAVAIGKEIRRVNKDHGTTSIIVTHDRDLAFGIADTITFMAQGRLTDPQTPEEIKSLSDPQTRQFLHAGSQKDYL